ncbi:hypothetical protein [Nucisporomicrobium flavum]|uniref:hypothetical protein n=1 Tax=Nucisporomicrobium flavum TaxID=2785915 RepID=UPI0018F29C11|nr:hypothetical protein [Nucisporomicrobium flavum]
MTITDPELVATTADAPAGVRSPRRSLLLWGDTLVGAAIAAEQATTGVVAGLRRGAARRAQRLSRLADRGALAREDWRRRAEDVTRAAVTTVATSPVVDRVVDHQLERVLRPIVLAVLDDVLLLLEKEPERIQTLIRGQRETMVDELVGRLRSGTEAGDTAVDRLTARIFHRGPRPDPPPPLDL